MGGAVTSSQVIDVDVAGCVGGQSTIPRGDGTLQPFGECHVARVVGREVAGHLQAASSQCVGERPAGDG